MDLCLGVTWVIVSGDDSVSLIDNGNPRAAGTSDPRGVKVSSESFGMVNIPLS